MIVAEGATAACVLVRSVAAWALGAAALLLVAFSSVLYRAVGSGRARHCHCFDDASTAHPRAHIACNLGLAVAALAAAATGWAPVAPHPGRSVFGVVLGLGGGRALCAAGEHRGRHRAPAQLASGEEQGQGVVKGLGLGSVRRAELDGAVNQLGAAA